MLDNKSGHAYGKFNNIKCNRIPTQRSMQKLFTSNSDKSGATKDPPKATPLWLMPHQPTKQAKLAGKLEGKNIRIIIVIPSIKGKTRSFNVKVGAGVRA